MGVDNRKKSINGTSNKAFDVAILGGGINGAVCATALAASGVSVLLLEKSDFASGTSQESSNLVWGGIKYLETLQLPLVFSLCRSRNHLLRHYPSSVQEMRFLTSIDPKFRWPKIAVYFATLFYWLMGGFYTKRPKILGINQMFSYEPIINHAHSSGGVEYSDCHLVDHDARFAFNFIQKAKSLGASCLNYMAAERFEKETAGPWHITAIDQVDKTTNYIFKAKIIVNAAGPFADLINEKLSFQTRHQILFSKGVHLLVRKLTPHNRILTFFADDGRMFFVIPFGERSCIGTTDTRESTPNTRPTDQDRDFILTNINRLLNLEKKLTKSDIIAERCGVRALVAVKTRASKNSKALGDSPRNWIALSRKHVIETSPAQNVICIFGGKLTDCLNVGREVRNLVRKIKGASLQQEDLKVQPKNSTSEGQESKKTMRWYGEPPIAAKIDFFHKVIPLLQSKNECTGHSFSGDGKSIAERLWRNYGLGTSLILKMIQQNPLMKEPIGKGIDLLRCEVHYAREHEMVVHLQDFVRRRTNLALVYTSDELKHAAGLMEVCEILFDRDANKKYLEYFESVSI